MRRFTTGCEHACPIRAPRIALLLLSVLLLGSCAASAVGSTGRTTVPVLDFPYTVDPSEGLATDVASHFVHANYGGVLVSGKITKPWVQAIAIASAIDGSPAPAVYMDWLRLKVRKNGERFWTTVAADEYAGGAFSVSRGAFYARDRWSYIGPRDESIPVTLADSILVMPVDRLDVIYHWWTDGYVGLVPGDGFRVETRLKLVGGVLLQAGIDLKDHESENYLSPALVTDWYGPTAGNWVRVKGEYPSDLPRKARTYTCFLDFGTAAVNGVSYLGDSTGWTAKAMDHESAGSYSFSVALVSGEIERFNVSYQLNGHTCWAATNGGFSFELRSVACIPDEGSASNCQFVSNGLSGSQASQNMAFTAN